MAAWFTVYCTKSVAGLTAAELRAGIEHDDWFILAESYGLDDDAAVERAVKALRVERITKPKGVRFRLRYRPAKLRPVLVHVWDDPERVRVEREEALEQFEGDAGRGATRIRKHLGATAEVVALEMGWPQLDDMGVVFAARVAEFVAMTADGLIRDPHDTWWAMKKGVAVRVDR